MSSTKYFY